MDDLEAELQTANNKVGHTGHLLNQMTVKVESHLVHFFNRITEKYQEKPSLTDRRRGEVTTFICFYRCFNNPSIEMCLVYTELACWSLFKPLMDQFRLGKWTGFCFRATQTGFSFTAGETFSGLNKVGKTND